jgi:three-Cys-motif partner protein
MSPKETVWKLDPHTRGKHEVLRHYLAAWFPILGLSSGRIVFIDGFAGPGEYAEGEKGSPLIAIDAFRQHAHRLKKQVCFLFIEKDSARARHLRKVLKAQPPLPSNCILEIATGDFESQMTKLLDDAGPPGSRLAPLFVMLDPFGVSGTPMSVIGRLLTGGKGEVYVSFMYESISRFRATPEFEGPLTQLFGTEEWKKGIPLKGEARRNFFYGLYESQLRKAGAKHVLHFDLYEGNRLVYAIFFATRHWVGADRMKQAIWRIAPFGDFAFRGTHSGQLPLGLGEEVDYTALRKTLQARFRGKGWVSIQQVIEFVGSDLTDFHTGQLKKPVLVPMETKGLLEVDPKTRSRARTFPDGTKLRFL